MTPASAAMAPEMSIHWDLSLGMPVSRCETPERREWASFQPIIRRMIPPIKKTKAIGLFIIARAAKQPGFINRPGARRNGNRN